METGSKEEFVVFFISFSLNRWNEGHTFQQFCFVFVVFSQPKKNAGKSNVEECIFVYTAFYFEWWFSKTSLLQCDLLWRFSIIIIIIFIRAALLWWRNIYPDDETFQPTIYFESANIFWHKVECKDAFFYPIFTKSCMDVVTTSKP